MNYTKLSFVTALFFLTSFLSGQSLHKDALTGKKDLNQNDTLLKSIHTLQAQNDLLNSTIKKQSSKIDTLIDKEQNSNFNYFKDFIYPILLSVIAGIVFWLIFSFLPERRRRNKLRPKLDLDMYNVYTKVFSVFDLVMRPNNHSPSNFQDKIKGNKLTKEDLELGLQDKCLNETYLYDKNVSPLLIVIGRSLYEIAKRIDTTVDRLFSFSNYLTADEILLLEKIRNKLQVYELSNYNRNAVSIIDGMELKPVNPSLSYMSQNLFELYQLFIQYQEVVYGNNYIDRDISISKVQHYFYSGQYNKCKSLIESVIAIYPKDKNLLDFYFFMSEYMLEQKVNSYLLLENILRDKPHLVSSRNFLNDMLKDKNVSTLLEKYYTEKEIVELNAVLIKEDLYHKAYIHKANELLKYYNNKSESTKQSSMHKTN